MCGIVGIVGTPARGATQIVEALKRLEYRGYDSAGVATLEDGRLDRRRAEGKLRNLEAKLAEAPLPGLIGIGHTRWATHGKPNETNAHPHATDRLAVVHNGIIENFRELKTELEAKGVRFETETDTEVVAQLVTCEMHQGRGPDRGGRRDAAAPARRIRARFHLRRRGRPDDRRPPRRAARGRLRRRARMYLGSDALALAPFTDEVAYLEDGDWAILTRKGVEIRDDAGQTVAADRARRSPPARSSPTRAIPPFHGEGNPRAAGSGRPHARPLCRTSPPGRVELPFELPFDFKDLKRLSISACGTAYLAGLVAKYWFERIARIPVEIDVASEFRYREAPLEPGSLAIFVSQSGETADTLASLRYAERREAAHRCRSSTCRPRRSRAKATSSLPTLAGPEIGVASTKAFTCQLAVLLCLAIAAGRARGTLSARRRSGSSMR